MTGSAVKPPGRLAGWRRPAVLVVALAAAVFAARDLGLAGRLGELRGWIESLGAWGGVAFIALFAAGTVAGMPGSALTVAAGAMFGSLWGIVLVSIGATMGAALAFLVSRYFAREAVARWLAGKEWFRKLDRMTAEHGAIVVAVTRLVPLFPYNLLNYGFGLTNVPFLTYIFWSWLCMIPGDALYIVGTDTVYEGIRSGRIPWLLVLILAFTGLLLAFLVRFSRSKLRAREGATPEAGDR